MNPTLRARGYSLAELIIVIGVVTLVVAIVIVRLGGEHRSVAEITADEIVKVLRRTRELATSDSRTYHLRIDGPGGRLWIEDPDTPLEPLGNFALDSRVTVTVVMPDEPERLSLRGRPRPGARDRVVFEADGSASPREIEVRGPDGVGVRITVAAAEGRIRVFPLQP